MRKPWKAVLDQAGPRRLVRTLFVVCGRDSYIPTNGKCFDTNSKILTELGEICDALAEASGDHGGAVLHGERAEGV